MCAPAQARPMHRPLVPAHPMPLHVPWCGILEARVPRSHDLVADFGPKRARCLRSLKDKVRSPAQHAGESFEIPRMIDVTTDLQLQQA